MKPYEFVAKLVADAGGSLPVAKPSDRSQVQNAKAKARSDAAGARFLAMLNAPR